MLKLQRVIKDGPVGVGLLGHLYSRLLKVRVKDKGCFVFSSQWSQFKYLATVTLALVSCFTEKYLKEEGKRG